MIAHFAKFGAVGAIGTVINLIVFQILHSLGVFYLIAASASFLVAASSNYMLNRRWTFGAEKDTWGGWAAYVLVNLVGLGTNLGTLSFLSQIWQWNLILAQLAGIAAGTVVNFVLSRRWVFGAHGAQDLRAFLHAFLSHQKTQKQGHF